VLAAGSSEICPIGANLSSQTRYDVGEPVSVCTVLKRTKRDASPTYAQVSACGDLPLPNETVSTAGRLD
jgi:hypothetical protein